MKRIYEKPTVLFERMEFNSAIANSCAAILTADCQAELLDDIACTPFTFAKCLNEKLFDPEFIACEDGGHECYHTSAGVQGLS